MSDDLWPDHIRIVTIEELIEDFRVSGEILQDIRNLMALVEEVLQKDSEALARQQAELLWNLCEVCRHNMLLFDKGLTISDIEKVQTSLDSFIGNRI